MPLSKIQLGKSGITENFIATLKTHFKKHSNVKVSVLKSAREAKDSTKKYSEEILEKVGTNYSARVVGFIINLKRLRRGKVE